MKKLWSILVFVTMIVSISTQAFASSTEELLTKGQAVNMLLNAGDAYAPNIQKSDIIKGDINGNFSEDKPVSRVEALSMLRRAFGNIPSPVGHNLRVGFPAEKFTDVPEWAKSDINILSEAGILEGDGNGKLLSYEYITKNEFDVFIDRMYSLEGTNIKDDFYAAVNKETLDKSVIRSGEGKSNIFSELKNKSDNDIKIILKEITSTEHKDGTKEQKISDLYRSILALERDNPKSLEPFDKYKNAILEANTIEELMNVQKLIKDDIGSSLILGFGLDIDSKNSNEYILMLNGYSPNISKDIYIKNEGYQKEAYIKYLTKILTLSGLSDETAAEYVNTFYNMERILAIAMMDVEESMDVDKTYNIFTLSELQKMFVNIDLNSLLSTDGFTNTDKVVVNDIGLIEAYSKFLTEDNIDVIKANLYIALFYSYGDLLDNRFVDAENEFSAELSGIQGSKSDEEKAILVLGDIMSEYLGEIYVDKYFSNEARNDVKKMISDLIEIYKSRLAKVEWMSDTTKKAAIEKLESMVVKVGYPDKWETFIDNAEITGPDDGGSYFKNMCNIYKCKSDWNNSLQGKPVDKNIWGMAIYEINAYYNPSKNEIAFPAGILQAPFYDINKSKEENLGGIGNAIAHEITHAFDNDGAKYDKDGNANDWWLESDYINFQKLCDETIEYYDGVECVPGITTNGTRTLSENIADQGAVQCITDAAAKLDNPDYKSMYTNLAKCWSMSATRDYINYLGQVDIHAYSKHRVNLTVVNCEEFIKAFDIQEEDGMYVKPNDRISIW